MIERVIIEILFANIILAVIVVLVNLNLGLLQLLINAKLCRLSCRIFAGYNKTIRIFDIHRPGRDFEQHSTLQGNKEGQSGNRLL